MNEDTIVAIYDTAAHAEAAVRELEEQGIPSGAISRHAAGATNDTTPRPPREQGFWSSLFGGEPDHDSSVYERSLEAGSHVVTVKVGESHVAGVSAILERHNPIDIDERAAAYGIAGTHGENPPQYGGERSGAGWEQPGATTGSAMPSEGMNPSLPMTGRPGAATGDSMRQGDERLQLAEEQLNVGKRLVNHGTTRIRRFVTETPVEENVTLHSEQVSIERRPVTGDARIDDANFTDRTIEVTETNEEAVVGKTARIREEVVVRKNVADRVETVRDTVRREDVEITKDGVTQAGSAEPAAEPPVRR